MVFWTGLCVCVTVESVFRAEEGEEVPLVVGLGVGKWARSQAARERWLEEMTVQLIERPIRLARDRRHTQPGPGGTWLVCGPETTWGRYDTFVSGDLYGGRDEQLVISKVMLHLGKEQPAEFMTSRS